MVLEGRVTVFISCSERFKRQVAVPFREAFEEAGLRGVILSDEPQLSHTGWEPDSKIESYMDASDAVVALCTPDDRLEDQTVQCRPNIVDEIQRARSKPHLRDRTQVLKAPEVRLPSNINPTYEELDPDHPDPAIETALKQLKTWGVVPGPPSRNRRRPTSEVKPDAGLAPLIRGLDLGDLATSESRAYDWLWDADQDAKEALIGEIRIFMLNYQNPDNTDLLNAAMTLEAIGRLEPRLISMELVQELASNDQFSTRSSAAVLLWERAAVSPADVPLQLVGRLAVSSEDWYVQAPAMAAVKMLMRTRREARMILDALAASDDSEDRHSAAEALFDLGRIDPTAVPPDLVDRLAQDDDELVRRRAADVQALISAHPPEAYERRFRPFGL
jgi:hypothetical protein